MVFFLTLGPKQRPIVAWISCSAQAVVTNLCEQDIFQIRKIEVMENYTLRRHSCVKMQFLAAKSGTTKDLLWGRHLVMISRNEILF